MGRAQAMSLSTRHPATPGAYLQRADQSGPPTATLRTDIAGFVGIAERGPIGIAVVVESFRQFQAVFGNFIGGGYLAYSLRAFFENGGRRARVVRVASDDPDRGAAAASLTIPVVGGGPTWIVAASTPGRWGNHLSVSFVERAAGQTLIDQTRSTPVFAAVASTAAFGPNSLVRLMQAGSPPQVRVLASIDATQRLLYFVDPDPARRGGRQAPVYGFDPNAPLIVETVTYDLLVYSQGELAAVAQGLSLVPEAQNYAAILVQPIDYSVDERPPGALPLVTLIAPTIAPDATPAPLAIVADALLPLSGGRDGLAVLTEDDFIGTPAGALAGSATQARGLAALALAPDVAIIAAPDILIRPIAPPHFVPVMPDDPCPVCPPEPQPAMPVPPIPPELPPIFSDRAILAVQAAMIQQCESLATRVALLDPPWDVSSGDDAGSDPVQGWRDNFDSAFAALYFPWLCAPDPLRLAPVRAIPPSGHIAGLIAATDLAIGVHKAPANAELAWVQNVTIAVDPATHGVLNTAGINVIRGDNGRPLRVMGARTVSPDPNFRFLNVRRLLCMVRVALDLCTRWVVFEPNNPHTRLSLTATITRFLNQLWKQGALAGTTAAAAFQVLCNDSNNPPTTQDMGELFVDIGLAPCVPFEFVLLRLGRSTDSLDIEERGVLAAGSG
jgi:uncharacterized protein